jgi:DNA-binding transcriptional ArsR family regulator
MAEDRVFRALADRSRRLLLDQLFERDGQTLLELQAHLPEMTRFGVMSHLAVLEEAGLVLSRRRGRKKYHYLNPVPIRLIHDRWVSKYRAPFVSALSELKRELEGGDDDKQIDRSALYARGDDPDYAGADLGSVDAG